MKLSSFITRHMEDVLVEWESFARTLQPPGAGMSPLALRNHAKQILHAIALDMDAVETPSEQYRKSQGLAPVAVGVETAASTHGALRQLSGFSLTQLTAEFRALRATVLRLWLPQVKALSTERTNDMVRFNETIDQALAEAVATYSARASRTRDTFLAILGHDLRSPLATLAMAGEFLVRPDVGTGQTLEVGARVKRSAAAMNIMVNDLLEYARSQLGSGIPIHPQPGDFGQACRWAVEDIAAAHPDRQFEIDAQGSLECWFDAGRIQQLLSNLLNNAVQYGGSEQPILLQVRADETEIELRVHNHGSLIDQDSLGAIFDPLFQVAAATDDRSRPWTSLGLGLFIAREIAHAHGGRIRAASDADTGTVFIVDLPRNPGLRAAD